MKQFYPGYLHTHYLVFREKLRVFAGYITGSKKMNLIKQAPVKICAIALFALFGLTAKAQNTVTGLTISARSDAITYGTPASVTYSLELALTGDATAGSTDLSLHWIGTPPAEVTYSFSPTPPITLNSGETLASVILTVIYDGSDDAGTYGFTVSSTSDPHTSNATSLIIDPALLTIEADDDAKTYGIVYPTGSGSTAFTATGLVGTETIGSVTIASTGAPANASVAGSPYAIVASAATGGSFNPANYTIDYDDGMLTVSPVVATISVSSDNSPTCFNSSVTFTATIASALSDATGQVEFF